MEIQKDFKEYLALLNDHEVEYMIVGGYALAYYGAPRFTGDIDIFIKPDEKNAQRILNVLADFGFSSLEINLEDLVSPDNVIQLGVPPFRIDMITSLSGISWESANENKEPGRYGDIPVYFIGKREFVLNKKATGRKKDQADLEALGEE
jgi:hypothetical protein